MLLKKEFNEALKLYTQIKKETRNTIESLHELGKWRKDKDILQEALKFFERIKNAMKNRREK